MNEITHVSKWFEMFTKIKNIKKLQQSDMNCIWGVEHDLTKKKCLYLNKIIEID